MPLFDEVVLSTAALSEIRSFDPVAGVLVAEAGCILETLDTHLAGQGFTMPLDLGAKGSCHIGGNISTNAGEEFDKEKHYRMLLCREDEGLEVGRGFAEHVGQQYSPTYVFIPKAKRYNLQSAQRTLCRS